MYKSAIAIGSLIIFAAAVLCISLMQVTHPSMVFSKTFPKPTSLTPTPPNVTPTPIAIDYYLPYPGILPDHTLWSLKALRDYLWVSLTFNPQGKSEKLLHLADKRIGAAEALINGGQSVLGASVATKAGKYLEQALAQESLARGKGASTSDLLTNIAKSSLKQQEIVSSIRSKATDQAIPSLNQSETYSRQAYETASQRLRELHLPVPGQI